MLKDSQLKQLSLMHEIIQHEVVNHENNDWVDFDWCMDYMTALQRLDQALTDIEYLCDVPIVDVYRQ